jgi:hypothetical protein
MRQLSESIARATRLLARSAAAALLGLAAAAASAYTGPGALQARYTELSEQLRNNNFHRALYIESSEAGDTLKGDVYAVLDHPFATVSGSLKNPADWCDIMLLPFNTKYCRAVENNGEAALQVRIGRKHDQPVQDAYKVDFAWRPVVVRPDYFESRLTAGQGPIGTRDYRILVAAIPLDRGRRSHSRTSNSGA